jgi:hypothetical protein
VTAPIPPEPHEGPKPAEEKSEVKSSTASTTFFHHGCKDFRLENKQCLSLTNCHGDKVCLVSEGKDIAKLLQKAIDAFTKVIQ